MNAVGLVDYRGLMSALYGPCAEPIYNGDGRRERERETSRWL